MIIGHLSHCHRYFSTHPLFKTAFNFIMQVIETPPEQGKHYLVGDSLIGIVETGEGKTREKARLEAHRKYIDIQFASKGVEEIGWKRHSDCKNLSNPYIAEKDIEFFADKPDLWIPLIHDAFAIFFPEDAHAPLAGSGPVHKIIMKVAVEE